MRLPTLTLMNEVSAEQLDKPSTMAEIVTNANQKLLAKEVFSQIITQYKKKKYSIL